MPQRTHGAGSLLTRSCTDKLRTRRTSLQPAGTGQQPGGKHGRGGSNAEPSAATVSLSMAFGEW